MTVGDASVDREKNEIVINNITVALYVNDVRDPRLPMLCLSVHVHLPLSPDNKAILKRDQREGNLKMIPVDADCFHLH